MSVPREEKTSASYVPMLAGMLAINRFLVLLELE
jgi:hypothetical protein